MFHEVGEKRGVLQPQDTGARVLQADAVWDTCVLQQGYDPLGARHVQTVKEQNDALGPLSQHFRESLSILLKCRFGFSGPDPAPLSFHFSIEIPDDAEGP